MNINTQKITGHLLALLVVGIWSITYVATDMLLSEGFTALHILVLRFILALIVLFAAKPRLCFPKSIKEELGFVLLSAFGMGLYYVFENYAIGMTDGTNVSILISFAPILTTVGSVIFKKSVKLKYTSVLGFVIAITGVALVVFNGTVKLDFNVLGYVLAISAALCWAIYSVLLEDFLKEHDSLTITRRMLVYTLIWLIPMMLATDGSPDVALLKNPVLLGCLSLLGIFGGSLCYLWWNTAVKRVGVVVTTNYLYLSPFITMVFAFFVTDTPITAMGAAGAAMIVGGVVLSDL